jgi:hypothetical protein
VFTGWLVGERGTSTLPFSCCHGIVCGPLVAAENGVLVILTAFSVANHIVPHLSFTMFAPGGLDTFFHLPSPPEVRCLVCGVCCGGVPVRTPLSSSHLVLACLQEQEPSQNATDAPQQPRMKDAGGSSVAGAVGCGGGSVAAGAAGAPGGATGAPQQPRMKDTGAIGGGSGSDIGSDGGSDGGNDSGSDGGGVPSAGRDKSSGDDEKGDEEDDNDIYSGQVRGSDECLLLLRSKCSTC